MINYRKAKFPVNYRKAKLPVFTFYSNEFYNFNLLEKTKLFCFKNGP